MEAKDCKIHYGAQSRVGGGMQQNAMERGEGLILLRPDDVEAAKT